MNDPTPPEGSEPRIRVFDITSPKEPLFTRHVELTDAAFVREVELGRDVHLVEPPTIGASPMVVIRFQDRTVAPAQMLTCHAHVDLDSDGRIVAITVIGGAT